MATYRSCVLLPSIQGTSESFGGLGIFVLYPESMKVDNTQADEMPESEEQELLNIYSGLLTAQISFCFQELPERCAKPLLKV